MGPASALTTTKEPIVGPAQISGRKAQPGFGASGTIGCSYNEDGTGPPTNYSEHLFACVPLILLSDLHLNAEEEKGNSMRMLTWSCTELTTGTGPPSVITASTVRSKSGNSYTLSVTTHSQSDNIIALPQY